VNPSQKCAQNVHREPGLTQAQNIVTPQQSNGPSFCIRLTVSVSVLQVVIITSWVSVLPKLHWKYNWKCNCSCVLSVLWNKFSKFCIISSIVSKIMEKVLWLHFFHVVLLLGYKRQLRVMLWCKVAL